MPSQYLRKASLLIGNSDSGIDLSSLQYRFSVKMADLTHPQFASFRIYNISKATLSQIKDQEYTRVVFEAGYQEGAYGRIFDGEVIQGRRGRESPVDTYVDLLCAVGYSANQAPIAMTLGAGSTSMDAAEAAASAMGTPITSHVAEPPPSLPRGQVLYGMARDHLTTAANSSDATWFHTEDGVVLVDGDGFVPQPAIVLNAATGMINWPEQTQDGIKVRCLLNSQMAVGTLIQLDNASIQRAEISPDYTYVNMLPDIDADGLYRVLYFEHQGDTRGQSWYTDIIGVAVNQTANGGISSLYQRGLF